ncbi:MAG: hypothetical protein U1E45_17665 [Geminicoccaceae bacterium]
MSGSLRRAFLLASVAALAAGTSASSSAKDITRRMSVGPFGVEADAASLGCCNGISGDGRYLAFTSTATNLVPNGATGVFVRDRMSGMTKNVSLGIDGKSPDGPTQGASISVDGRFVLFSSAADNLARGDTNKTWDVFITDRKTGLLRRVSVGNRGAQAKGSSIGFALTADGGMAAFWSDAPNLVPGDTNGENDVFLRDLKNVTTERISVSTSGEQGNGLSYWPAISHGGDVVAYASSATNLVANDTNRAADIFVRDRKAGTTERVSLGPNGIQGNGDSLDPQISADGRFVAFRSIASNLVPGDTNGTWDVFVRDRKAGTTVRVSVGSKGEQGNGFSAMAAITPDGRFVAFGSEASNLVPNDRNRWADTFLHDMKTGATIRTSISASGEEGDNDSVLASLSADGRLVMFTSLADNMVPGDRNGEADVFLRILRP